MRFRVERVLAAGDHSSPEGRDRMLDELRPVFRTLPPSALRMELMRLVSGRLALSESLVETLLSGGGERARADRRAGGGRPRGAAAGARSGDAAAPGRRGRALSGARRPRGRFSRCALRLPRRVSALSSSTCETYFTSDLLRRAARHLQTHLREPLRDRRREDVRSTPTRR